MRKCRYLLVVIFICLLAILSAGCETSFPEWSGNMPNQNGKHVEGEHLNRPPQYGVAGLRMKEIHRGGRGQSFDR